MSLSIRAHWTWPQAISNEVAVCATSFFDEEAVKEKREKIKISKQVNWIENIVISINRLLKWWREAKWRELCNCFFIKVQFNQFGTNRRHKLHFVISMYERTQIKCILSEWVWSESNELIATTSKAHTEKTASYKDIVADAKWVGKDIARTKQRVRKKWATTITNGEK